MKRVLVALIAILTSAGAASAQSKALSVDEAVAIAIGNNLMLQNAALQVEKAEHDLESARSRRMPSFSIESQASQLLTPVNISFPRGAFGDYPGVGPIPSTDATITTPARMSLTASSTTSPISSSARSKGSMSSRRSAGRGCSTSASSSSTRRSGCRPTA